MKQIYYFYFTIMVVCLLAISCQRDPRYNSLTPCEVDESKLNTEAIKYFSNIKTAIFATGSNLPITRSEQEMNPLVAKLESIVISNGKTSSNISFFELDEFKQESFLNDWVLIQAEQMSRKIASNPELLEYVILENKVIDSVMNEELVETKNGRSLVKNNKVFFDKIQERIAGKGKEFEAKIDEQQENNPSAKANFAKNNYTITVSQLRSNLTTYSRKGDFIVALPVHGQPYVYLNTEKDKFTVGHSSIITTNVTNSMNDNQNFAIGAQSEGIGVTEEALKYWNVKSFIVGIQKVRWVEGQGEGECEFYQVTEPVSNPDALAYWAKLYVGREYVKWLEFPIAKSVAPTRFTCTTLIWWSAKKAYDVDISSWWVQMVTPSGLLTSESTYIRRVID